MSYKAEMDFMIRALSRMRLQVMILAPVDSLEPLDFGLRRTLGISEDYQHAFDTHRQLHLPRTIYRVMDQFLCSYIFFHLPKPSEHRTLVIGPYMTYSMTHEQIMEEAERQRIPMQYLPVIEDYYASLPIVSDTSALTAIVNTFGETLWGQADAYETVDVNYEQKNLPLTILQDSGEQADILMQMKNMETRYAYENEMLDIVTKGLTNQVEQLMNGISQLNFRARASDPLRNMKNYCIVCNTLLRKAAERGGVHPIHLDRMSDRYARTIENLTVMEAGIAFIKDMFRSYCRLVRTHSLQQYTAIVQKTLTYIESNLSGDLQLHTLADIQQISPNYLSTIFRAETGKTLTQYVNEQRMKNAMKLLQSTRLQIQTIGQLCGIPDANYFSKLFRKHYGITPSRLREDAAHRTMPV